MPAIPTPRAEGGAAAVRLQDWLAETRVWAEEVVARALPPEGEHPPLLHEGMRYALLGGGKRLRPALVRLFCAELGGTDAQAEAPAAAVELVHGYSLVHDDLPCMDDDDLRRGRPTCHVKYGEALGVLIGDALQAEAFRVLGEARGLEAERVRALVAVLARSAGSVGMVGGQVLDLTLPVRGDGWLDADAVRGIHTRKTAALIAAAVEMGAIAAGADPAQRAAVRRFGVAWGLLFQAVDDLLDVTGDAATLGKTPGKDAALERLTLVAALGEDGARAEAARLAEEARGAVRELGWGADSLPAQLVDYCLGRSA